MVEKPIWNNARKVNHQNSQRISHPHSKRNFVPKAVLMKSSIKTPNTARQNSSRAAVTVNTSRPINTAYPRSTVNYARPAPNVFNKAHSHVERPFNKITTNKNSNFNEKVNTVKGNVTTVGQKQTWLEHSFKQAVPVVDTATDEPLGLGYEAARCRTLALADDLVPSTFEIGQSSRSVPEKQKAEETPAPSLPIRPTWVDPRDGIVFTDIECVVPPVRALVQTPPSPERSSGSLPVSLASLLVSTSIASPANSSPVASPATIEARRFMAELGAQVEFQGGLLHDHAQHLNALPPALFEGYDRDLRELYPRSKEVRDEIFSQRYRLKSLE
ncbi:hypothetical protein Tco_1280681 [Tanacetum coccineum]